MRVFSVKKAVIWGCTFRLKPHVVISEFSGVCNSSSEILWFLFWGKTQKKLVYNEKRSFVGTQNLYFVNFENVVVSGRIM